MSTTTPSLTTKKTSGIIAGAALILIGVLIFAGQFIEIDGNLFLFGLGGIFLVWALISRVFGLLIPGSILLGLAGSAYLVEGPLAYLSDLDQGAVVMFGLAAGFVLISALSPATNRARGWAAWPLIPAACIAAAGGAMITGQNGVAVLEFLGKAWPLVLVIIGLSLIFKRAR
jgi:hypothetical protein